MMISQFWNLCRACPALDVDKLHSEYRSTYRWHEYTPKQTHLVRTAQPQPQPLQHSNTDGGEFSRGRKKRPDVAYKCHEFFDVRASKTVEQDNRMNNRCLSTIATLSSLTCQERRSQSEGPLSSENRTRRQRTRGQEPRTSSQGVTFPSEMSRHSSLRSRERVQTGKVGGEPKKSVSMGHIQPTGHLPPTGTERSPRSATRVQDVNGNTDAKDGGGGTSQAVSASPARAAKEYKSEYKQKFRPFSQYEYCGDGKFHKTSVSPPSETVPDTSQPTSLSGSPWFQEVIELRKAANDYKCRGWGTDLVPPHLSQIYTQHVDEATKRESLSALALAITPRSMNKDEKENLRKSPTKPRSRPRTAPPKGSKKTSRSESARSTPGLCKEVSKTDSAAPAKPGATVGGQGGWKVHLAQDNKAGLQRPNGESGGVSRASSKAASRDVTRPTSAIENNIDYFKEPVVKSPPEPTRVRSPEQLMMRSPDPINWTVPLDTGKTFQVTQSVRENDSARNSPMSDHSSHFDSVLGTAINLGIHSVNEKGGLHYPKVSALAREAKELQGVRTKKEEKPAEGSVNGALNGSPETGLNGVEKDRDDNKVPQESTNIKCLEDPNFSFDEPKASKSEETGKANASVPAEGLSQPPKNKKPSYRVLEDPELDLPGQGGQGGFKSDPMTTSIYQPRN